MYRSFDKPYPDISRSSLLITGGTGSFGRAFVRELLRKHPPQRLVVFSRDEQKQEEMAHELRAAFPQHFPIMRFFIGDVRDVSRLEMAMRDIDFVVHAAALKIVPTAEYNPFECILTNVHGTENVLKASLRCGVKKVVALSTDKAANPINIYGERYTWVGNVSQAIPMQIKKVMDGDDPVVVWGSGTQRRNYLHAFDCADAMAGLVEAGFIGAVNIGTEDTVELRELVQTICKIAGRSPRLVPDTTKPEGRRVKSADSALLRRAYPGFARRIDLDNGLSRMLAWYRANFGGKAA